eukprot:scaffold229650_cov19-Tisochrysis_lutea.AAC.2
MSLLQTRECAARMHNVNVLSLCNLSPASNTGTHGMDRPCSAAAKRSSQALGDKLKEEEGPPC